MHFLFIGFCTNVPLHMVIQVVLDICTSTCSKMKCIFVYTTSYLAFICAWDEALYVKQHK